MDAATFRKQLELLGVEVLAVTGAGSSPQALVVYLHGNAGQWAEDVARWMITGIPEVEVVQESRATPTILIVNLKDDS